MPRYEQYDEMYVDDNEWERQVRFHPFTLSLSLFLILISRMKASGEQYDDRIVEVHWDVTVKGWRIMRFRDDKPNGNHKSVVENIISTIADGVEKETVS